MKKNVKYCQKWDKNLTKMRRKCRTLIKNQEKLLIFYSNFDNFFLIITNFSTFIPNFYTILDMNRCILGLGVIFWKSYVFHVTFLMPSIWFLFRIFSWKTRDKRWLEIGFAFYAKILTWKCLIQKIKINKIRKQEKRTN